MNDIGPRSESRDNELKRSSARGGGYRRSQRLTVNTVRDETESRIWVSESSWMECLDRRSRKGPLSLMVELMRP